MKKIIDFNDNELIYLIRNNNEQAQNLLIKKYDKFIHLKIHDMQLKNHEDCFQEGLMVLFNCAKTYNEKYNKTFMKYFETILNNRFIDIKRHQEKDNNYLVLLDEKEIDYCSVLCEDGIKLDFNINDVFLSKLTLMERSVFYDYYLCNMSIDEIANKQKVGKKNIYYVIYRIKGKIKKYMVK